MVEAVKAENSDGVESPSFFGWKPINDAHYPTVFLLRVSSEVRTLGSYPRGRRFKSSTRYQEGYHEKFKQKNSKNDER